MKQSENSLWERLQAVPLFSGLEPADLERLAAGVEVLQLPRHSLLFEEGSEGDRAYVITEGEVEILKITGDREVLLARRGPGDVIGEMALLDGTPRMASVRASADSSVLTISKERMDELVATSATAARALFSVLLARWRQTQAQLQQTERMAQLGTLTAGLAHELNNPAAAVSRNAESLEAALGQLRDAIVATETLALDGPKVAALKELLDDAAAPGPTLSALQRADLESAVETALTAAGVAQPWILSEGIVATGVRDVDSLFDGFGESAVPVLQAIVATHRVHSLVRGIEEGASRMSAIVGALKSYSYLDQAPVQHVDISKGIKDTLMILEHKLSEKTVRLSFETLPEITAFGSELNQVWTNLLDNAADATMGRPDATIEVRARSEGSEIIVEIEDNGPGIAPEVLPKIFDAFFTTKPPGSGTGLGLDISYSIVVHRHRGELTVESQPGRTVFRVVLPVDPTVRAP